MTIKSLNTVRDYVKFNELQKPKNYFVICPHTNLKVSNKDFRKNLDKINYYLTVQKKQKKGSIICTLIENSLSSIHLMLGIMYSGMIQVPLNIVAGEEQLSYVVNHSDAKIILVSSKYLDLAQRIVSKVSHDIKIFENLLDGSENFALIKGNLKRNKNPRVRVISSNIVKNYLMGEKLPNSFNQTIEHFKNHKDCVLIFIRDSNLKSVSETLKGYKSKKFYKTNQDKLIKNYGIGAQIIKALNIKNMILVTRSKKKVIGLDGYGIKITNQEIIK